MYELPFFATTFPKLTLSNYFEEVHVVTSQCVSAKLLRSHNFVADRNNCLTFLLHLISGVGFPLKMSHPNVAASPW